MNTATAAFTGPPPRRRCRWTGPATRRPKRRTTTDRPPPTNHADRKPPTPATDTTAGPGTTPKGAAT